MASERAFARAASEPPARITAEPPGRRLRVDPTGESLARRPVVAEPGHATAGLRRLLAVEAELRRAPGRDALALALVNESAGLVHARQVFLLKVDRLGAQRVERVSGTLQVERNAPLVALIEAAVSGLTGTAPQMLDLSEQEGEEARSYPFRRTLFVAMADRAGKPIGGLVFTSERPFDEAEAALAARLAETGAHAMLALRSRALPRLSGDLRKPAIGIAVLLLAGLAFPVSMTALAPGTITAERPFVVAAPIEGIIEEITAAPDAPVKVGDVVVRYVDTAQANALAVAEREVQVADARLRQVTQAAYTDERARREIGQARAELALKTAERDFAKDTFARTKVVAERAGVAFYADRKEWYGKPVAAGQRILEIADPKTVEVRIDLPVADSIALAPGARVRVFLDSDPLFALEGRVEQATPVARVTDAGVLAYRVVARLAPGTTPPRLGAHGTAQLYGATVPFGFYLFRKPLTFLRQKFGL